MGTETASYPENVITQCQFDALPVTVRAIMASCEKHRDDERAFTEALEHLRFRVGEERRDELNPHQVETIKAALCYYRKLLHAKSMLYERLMACEPQEIGDSRIAVMVAAVREAVEWSGGGAIVWEARERLCSALLETARECLDDPIIAAALERARQRRRRKEKARLARVQLRTTTEPDDTHPGIVYSDVPTSSWLARLMCQRSSAGERVRPGFEMRHTIPVSTA